MTRRATLGLASALALLSFAAPSRAAGPVGQLYVPATACRALDTRLPAAPLGGPALGPGEARTLHVAGTCGVPSDALSLAVNLTVVNPSATGFAVLYAGDAAFPPTSNLGFSAHKTRAGFSIVSLASDGSGTIVLANGSPGNADYVLDVEGWFIRACTSTITVTNPGVTAGTVNTAFSQTFTGAGGVGALTFSTASPLPSGLTLSSGGVLSGTPTQTGTFDIFVTATDANGCTGTGAKYTLVIGCQTITVTNPVTTTGTANAPFSQTFTQTGGSGTVTFSTTDPLPIGLTLAANGVLSGTPTQAGSFNIKVTATDANGCSGTGATYPLVVNCQTITVTNPATTTGTAGALFSQTFTQSGAIGTATFTTASTLPAGLALAANGVLSGTPTQVGTFPVVVTVKDSNLCGGAGATYTLTIACQTITVVNPATSTATAGAAFSQQFTQSGAIGGATFTTASTLPSGLTLAANGVLSGTPTQTGSFPIVVTVTDANGCGGASATYTLVVGCPTYSVEPTGLPPATSGVSYAAVTFTAPGGIGGVAFSFTGSLPTGMNLSGGVLSGTPTQTGSFPITVKATDANGCTAPRDYILVVSCPGTPITLSPGTLPTVAANAVFPTTQFTASGGTGPYTFQQVGALPSGMQFVTDTLSGTPTATGTFPITIVATDAGGCVGSQDYVVTVSCVGTSISTVPGTVPGGTAGTPYVGVTFSGTGGTAPYVLAEVGVLPAGMSFAGGTLSGTPTGAGTFPFTVTATDANGCSGQTTYSLVVACQPIGVTNPATTSATEGNSFDVAFSATGLLGTATWSTASTLPTGLTLNASTGHLSGTPTQTGSFDIVVKATDTNGCSGTGATYTLVITCPTITVSGALPASLTYNTAWAGATFTQSGTSSTVTWSATGLPGGVAINPSTGAVTGTPTQTGTFSVTITATDAGGCTGSKSVSVAVVPIAPAQSYAGVGNTQLYVTGVAGAPTTPAVAVAATLLAGAQPAGGVTVTAASCSLGGTITTFDANGRFVFTPDVSATSATCAYTISSNTGGTGTPTAASGTISISMLNRVWWVDNATASGTNDGRSSTPFKTMTAVGSAATANGDFVYVSKGSGNTTGAYAMKPSQSLIGAGATLNVPTVSPILTVSGAAANTPTLSGTLTLANSVVVNGIDMSTGASRAVTNFNGASYSTVTGVSVTARTVATTTGTAIDIQGTGNTGTMSFTSVSANGATSGIVLQNFTGGSFTVAGNGTNDGSGGTIQNTTGDGISLSGASNVSLTSMKIQNTGHSGVKGVNGVQNFSFVNGTITGSGTASGTGDSNIAFNAGAYAPTAGTEKNLTGTFTVTGSTLTNAYYHGIDVYQFDGTVTAVNVSNNTLTSATSTSTSKGSGIRLVGFGSAGTVASYSKATIASNTITNFPSDAGILFLGGNATSTGAPAGTYGSDLSTNAIAITNNVISGQSAANQMGTQGINTALNGRGTGFFVITNNSITNVKGLGIGLGSNGLTVYTAVVSSNTIVAHNIFGSAGIGGGTTNTFSTADTPVFDVKINGNNISQTNGNGILVNAISATGQANVRILSNTVAAPTAASGTTYGIRVAAGNATSVNDSVCLEISGNTTAGDNDGAGTIAPGIGLRKQGALPATNAFGIVGLPAGSTSTPAVENYVNSQNPGSASGSFGVGGTALISATSGFTTCTEPGGVP